MRIGRVALSCVVLIAVARMGLDFPNSADLRKYGRTVEDDIARWMMKKLSLTIPVPDRLTSSWKKSETMIYVLGSTQESLAHHFRVAASLYKNGVADKIYFLSRAGLTEYVPGISRNLTNDEWSVRELGALGVPVKDLEAVQVPPSTFGTISEGRTVSRLAREKKIHRIILISSLHHTRRMHFTFSHFLKGGAGIYVYGSGAPADMGDLIAEFGKLIVYRRFLIPMLGWFDSVRIEKAGPMPKVSETRSREFPYCNDPFKIERSSKREIFVIARFSMNSPEVYDLHMLHGWRKADGEFMEDRSAGICNRSRIVAHRLRGRGGVLRGVSPDHDASLGATD